MVLLLTGLPGSGKTTFAKSMVRTRGFVRLSVDEEMFARHGRYGVDYPAAEHLPRLQPVLEDIQQRLVELIEAGRSVVLDHGLGQRAERTAYKRLVEQHGGTWRLVHLKVDEAELLARLAARIGNADTTEVPLSAETFAFIASTSQEPHDEGEETPSALLGH